MEPVVRVELLERDAAGRATEVEFEAVDADGVTMQYSLRYAYDLPGRRVLWRPGRNPDAGIQGVVVFEPDENWCRMIYTVQIGPTWADGYAGAKAVATAVVHAFEVWMNGSRELRRRGRGG